MNKENPGDFLKKIVDLKAKYLFQDLSELIEENDGSQIRCRILRNPFEANQTHVTYYARDDEPTNTSIFGKELSFSFSYPPDSSDSPTYIHSRWVIASGMESHLEAVNTFFKTLREASGEIEQVVEVSPSLTGEGRVLNLPISVVDIQPELRRSVENGEYGVKLWSRFGNLSISRMGVDTGLIAMLEHNQLKHVFVQEALGTLYTTTTICNIPRSVFDRSLSYVLSDKRLPS